jgi:hypothetical protein
LSISPFSNNAIPDPVNCKCLLKPRHTFWCDITSQRLLNMPIGSVCRIIFQTV